uniref:Putative secreted protein n=1 Tax=Anopheles darlingi TaxID=43151 RepID=A0A2M4DL58_ANODA
MLLVFFFLQHMSLRRVICDTRTPLRKENDDFLSKCPRTGTLAKVLLQVAEKASSAIAAAAADAKQVALTMELYRTNWFPFR